MPLRKEPPTPRSAAVAARLDGTQHPGTSSATALGPLIPVRPGETSLRRQAILTEDEYTSALSAVIKRDFFPDLDRMTAENEYLAAVEADDPRRIRAALERLMSFDGQRSRPAPTARKTRSSGQTAPATRAREARGEWDDTPVASASTSKVFDPTLTPAISTPGLDVPQEEQGTDDAEPSSGIMPDLSLSLADFQARYTSEDNASFAQLLERGNDERKRRHAWLYARERASVDQRRRIESAERKEAEAGRRLAIEANPDHPKLIAEGKTTPLLEDMGGSKATQPGSAPETDSHTEERERADPMNDLILVPEPRRDDRRPPPGLGRWKYTARNALMFGPDANADSLRAPTATATDDEATTNFAAIRKLDSSGCAGGVEAGGESEAGWSPSSSRVDAAIARGRAGSIASSFDAHDSPRVNGYGFVTPYLTPQHTLDEHLKLYNAIKARRTPGEADADAHSTGGRGFELPRLGKREELAQRLATPSSAKRVKPSPYGTQKYGGLAQLRARAFASPSKQSAAALSPAARALLDRSTRTLTPAPSVTRTASAHGSTTPAVRIGDRGWTPTPQHPQRRAR